MKKTLFTPLFVVAALAAHAQTITVTGRVLSASGEAQPGATVLQNGTTNGTAANANGEFSLAVPTGATLTISAIGYATQQVPLNGRTRLDVRLVASATDLGDVVVTGSRATEGRSRILTTAPVDVISARDIKAFAQTDVSQVLSFQAPSFQSARQTMADGTDHIDPASLRGLGPDQVLVLVNGKRRHQQSLVNINGTVGRGSVGTDLNVIPTASIKRIEVLRDGAAALYGSDAIAGVINIQLKDDSTGVSSSALYGQTVESDGKTEQVDFNVGIGLHERGFLDLSGQLLNRGYTNRGFADRAPLIYLGNNSGNFPNGLDEAGRRDLKAQDDALVAKNGFDRNDLRVGQSASRNFGGFVNGGYRLGAGYEAYVSGGATYRTGQGSGFNRLPNQATSSDLTIYPNGYLPFINTTIYDQSAIVGLRKTYGGFAVDLSNTFGRNELRYDVSNSINASIPQRVGSRNPTEFYSGRLAFAQNTVNLGATRRFTEVGPLATLNVAFGGEFRYDNFLIGRGEYSSYAYQGRVIGTTPANPGAQVFPGYQPQDEVNKSRTNVAGYLDLESDITEKLLVHAAGRAERYSDFGGNVSGQAGARYSITEGVALRGSIGNGFRAPSLQQRYFTSTATQVVSGSDPRQVLTANNDNALVRNAIDNATQPGFGVGALKQEKSTNYSLGLTARFLRTFTLTADLYQVDIRDRIVLSSQFTTSNPTVATILRNTPVSAIQFFANAVNTRTRGIDIVLNERQRLTNKSTIGFTAAANFNQTTVRSFNSSSSTINNDPTPGTASLQNTLFNRQQRVRLESGNPRSKIVLSANYTYGIFGIEARSVRFGEIQTADADPARAALDQTYSAKWISDLTVNAQLTKQINLAIGASNIFNVYPDKVAISPRNDPNNFSADPNLSYASNQDNSNRGRYLYNANQFGFNGAYYFARFNVNF
ncbi:TonB-dependent receptor [Hymenobacter sp. H14-R3]|uniref:TonB-dependent receptor n=1 Tax=Hymenobacter sp. H14-R3 TaxID=3046308 RepID=UPI0024B9D964|nr:TonB-dependent receptor [Hymenobacter sp. H14-R3]MDJ0365014.1 TonB-dependent receptor [Hymenobacter sp. H14-R3]